MLHILVPSASLRLPLNSDYKGFPSSQGEMIRRPCNAWPFCFLLNRFVLPVVGLRSAIEQGVRTATLQTVIDAAFLAADPDERRAQGPHSLVAESTCFRHELNRTNLARVQP